MLSEDEIYQKIYEKHQKLLIDPHNIDNYINKFPKEKKDLFNKSYFHQKRILITGISGFVGSTLVEKLLSIDQEVEIYGIVRRQSSPTYPKIDKFLNRIVIKEANLFDYSSLETTIKEVQPDYIFHLAAQSFVPSSFRGPIEVVRTNIEGTVNLLEIIRKLDLDIDCIHVAGSSEEYGLVFPDEIPIKESNPFRPQSPYAASKIATEHFSLAYHRMYGIPIVVTRGFNHTGPNRGVMFVTSVIANQIAKILRKEIKEIIIGNPNPIRDFTDIRDMIQGYLLAITVGKKGDVYNLGHGMGISIKNLIELTATLYNVKYTIKIDRTRFRPAEVPVLLCDYAKAKNHIGYYPQYPITETMQNLVKSYL
ncbi:MAG: GDP-mannose 4,6-dehydratase [Candidatus Heimdallarchaeum endolithica]|uniref:GDP-mannose 4,6-dehydratase n=1 Tax=Candidatus Heimdallarchaeum endolithica TaxID=2876572 RepID=A0A9Y1FPD3_9ARCH|nr:MAG: GDP-mannose 4,6-dehydratase [Candidatus Heimdallarchaeum endolithica]